MYDIIGDPKDLDNDKPACLVLEWMDCTLADLPRKHYLQRPSFLEAIVHAGLSGLATLSEENLVHTGRPSGLEGFIFANHIRYQTRKCSGF